MDTGQPRTEGSALAKTGAAAYTPQFRRHMVELVHAGRSPEELSREFELTGQSIRNSLSGLRLIEAGIDMANTLGTQSAGPRQ